MGECWLNWGLNCTWKCCNWHQTLVVANNISIEHVTQNHHLHAKNSKWIFFFFYMYPSPILHRVAIPSLHSRLRYLLYSCCWKEKFHIQKVLALNFLFDFSIPLSWDAHSLTRSPFSTVGLLLSGFYFERKRSWEQLNHSRLVMKLNRLSLLQ